MFDVKCASTTSNFRVTGYTKDQIAPSGSTCYWKIENTELESTAPACPIEPAQSRVFLTNAGSDSDVVSTYASTDASESF